MDATYHPTNGVFTRRQYMVRKLIRDGAPFERAVDAVNYSAVRHQRDWNMDEQRTWGEWEVALAKGRGQR